MSEQAKEIEINESHKALEAMREIVESVVEKTGSTKDLQEKMSGEQKEMFAKWESVLDKQEKASAEALEVKKALEKSEVEIKERMENLEAKMIKGSSKVDVKFNNTDEYKAYNELLAKGNFAEVSTEKKAYLRTDVGSQGGYLVPVILDNEIVKEVEEISDVRRLSRVKSLGVKTLEIPKRLSIPTASFEGEAEAAAESTSTYGNIALTASRQTFQTKVTRDQLNFSAFDVVAEMMDDAVTAFAQGEGQSALLGTGVKQMQGILDASAGVAQIDGSGSSTITLDDVIQLSGELKVGYKPVYFWNRKTLVQLRTEKDSNGNYLWRLGGETQPNTVNDIPYVILQDMPDIATDALAAGIGDFFRGYTILDAAGMEIVRDDLTEANKARVIYTWYRYLDGKVVLPEAFKLLKAVA